MGGKLQGRRRKIRKNMKKEKMMKEQKIYKGRLQKIFKKDENMKELGKEYQKWEK